MNNAQLATAIHILTLLAMSKKSISSLYIAGSVNINPVMVRRVLSLLRDNGLIETKEGKGGGSTLAKPADSIRLSDAYHAVNEGPLLGRTHLPNPECRVGKRINKNLKDLYTQAEQSLINTLDSITLADFCKKFK